MRKLVNRVHYPLTAKRTLALTALCLAALGCEDPIADPAIGALAIELGPDTASTLNCQTLDGSRKGFPDETANSRLDEFTTTEELEMMPKLTDGDGGEVTCSVVPQGAVPGSFTISAMMRLKAKVFSVVVTTDANATGMGTVSWNSPDTLIELRSSNCTISIDTQVEGGGAVVASFVCAGLVASSQPQNACSARGTFYLEGCTK